jgi:hypothetical protein
MAFEKLIVYQKAINFADDVCHVTEKFPKGLAFSPINSIERRFQSR